MGGMSLSLSLSLPLSLSLSLSVSLFLTHRHTQSLSLHCFSWRPVVQHRGWGLDLFSWGTCHEELPTWHGTCRNYYIIDRCPSVSHRNPHCPVYPIHEHYVCVVCVHLRERKREREKREREKEKEKEKERDRDKMECACERVGWVYKSNHIQNSTHSKKCWQWHMAEKTCIFS